MMNIYFHANKIQFYQLALSSMTRSIIHKKLFHDHMRGFQKKYNNDNNFDEF